MCLSRDSTRVHVLLIRFWPGESFLFQVHAIKKIAEYVAQLRRVGKGHGRDAYLHFHLFLLSCPFRHNLMINLTPRLVFFLSPMFFLFLNWLLKQCSLIPKLFGSWISGVWHFDQMLLREEGAVDAIVA